MSMIPIAILKTLSAQRVAGVWKNQIRTHRAEIHKAGEGDDPAVHCINNIATIELEEQLV
jgi:hypothetical protein